MSTYPTCGECRRHVEEYRQAVLERESMRRERDDLRAEVERLKVAVDIGFDELDRLHAAATPGPWLIVEGEGYAIDPDGGIAIDYSGSWPDENTREDLEFLVALRNAYPALREAVRERDELRKDRDKLRRVAEAARAMDQEALDEALAALDAGETSDG